MKSLEKAEKDRMRKHDGAYWPRKEGVLQPEGTTSTKTLRTEERRHILELKEGHKRQRARARARWYQIRQGRWSEAKSCRPFTRAEGGGRVWGGGRVGFSFAKAHVVSTWRRG